MSDIVTASVAKLIEAGVSPQLAAELSLAIYLQGHKDGIASVTQVPVGRQSADVGRLDDAQQRRRERDREYQRRQRIGRQSAESADYRQTSADSADSRAATDTTLTNGEGTEEPLSSSSVPSPTDRLVTSSARTHTRTREGSTAPLARSPAGSARSAVSPTAIPIPKPGQIPIGHVFHMKGTPEYRAWRAYAGRGFPTNQDGGWFFPTQWPPDHKPSDEGQPQAPKPVAF